MKRRIVFVVVFLVMALSLALPVLVSADNSDAAYNKGYAAGYADGLANREYDSDKGSDSFGSAYVSDYLYGYSTGYPEGNLVYLEKRSKGFDDTGYADFLSRYASVKDGPKSNWGYDDWKKWLKFLHEKWLYYTSNDDLTAGLEAYNEGLRRYQAWLNTLPLEQQLEIKRRETQDILDEIEIYAEIQRIEDAKAKAAAQQSAAAYAAKPITLKIDGRVIPTDSPPVIEGGRTLAPMRATVEALGFVVTWTSSTQTVNIYSYATDALMISLRIGSKIAKVNTGISGVMDERTLDVPAKLINGRTMVPVRFIAETLGCDVKWDEASKTVVITSAMG